MATTPITDSIFETEVLKAEGSVLVDFWAAWCGPCKMIAPVLDDISTEMGSNLKIVKINVDENPETPTTYQIRSIPTLMLFQNGKAVGTLVGAHPKAKITQWLSEHISA